MRGTVLHAPGDVRVEDRDDPTIEQPTDAIIRLSATCVCGSDLWPYRGIEARRRAVPDGPRVRRHRRGGRQRGPHHQARPVRRRLVLRLRQHLRDLPGRLPELAASTRADRRRSAPRPSWPRVPLADGTLVATPDMPDRRPDPEPAGRLRRARHRLVRRRRRRGRPGQDGRRRRRRRGRAARRAGRQAARRRADHRDEPPRAPAEARPRVRRHRHRRPSAATRASPGSRSSPTGSARTRSSRPSAPRSR